MRMIYLVLGTYHEFLTVLFHVTVAMSARDSSHRYAGDFPCACLCEKDSSIPVEENLVSVKKVIAIVLKAVIDMQNILFLTFAVSCMAKVSIHVYFYPVCVY